MEKNKFSLIPDWRKDIGSEKSLYQVAKVSFGQFGGKWENRIIVFLFSINACISLFAGLYAPEIIADFKSQLQFAHAFSALCVSYYSSMLGFIITALAISLGLLDRTKLYHLASIKMARRDFSEFKFLFFGFLYVIIVFAVSLLVSVIVWALAHPVGIFSKIEEYGLHESAVFFINSSLFVVFLYSLLQIKTLAWNLYQLIIADVILGQAEGQTTD